MAAAMPPDDVSALMTRVELDRSQYKVFDRHLAAQPGSQETLHSASHSVAKMHMLVSPPVSDPKSAEVQDGPRPRWNVLNSLLSVDGKDHVSPEPEALLVPMLTFSAGSGGVGKTTLLSSLARILSGMGESIFLIYSDSQRALPLHFGGQQIVPGRVRSFIPPARDFGQLHLYAHSQQSESEQDNAASWLPRQVNSLASEVGRVLCEVSASEIPEEQTLDLASVNLRILVPDINSVITVNRDLAQLESDQESNSTFYLLNKFDASVAFHRDVRERMGAILGERLLPFTIRRTDQFPEALAAGSTVLDYAPHAPVVEDLKLLAQWLRNSMPRHEIEPVRRLI